MLFLRLLLAHLAGDFLFQTNLIFRLKSKNIWGVALHSFIVFLTSVVVFLPWLDKEVIWLGLALLLVSHVLVDQLKNILDKKVNNKPFLFIFDQILHLAILICLAAWWGAVQPGIFIGTRFMQIYQNHLLTFLLAGLIFVSYVIDVAAYIFKSQCRENLKYRRNYNEMIWRSVLFAALFLLGVGWLIISL